MDRKEIERILAMAGARPRHALGQNFMVNQAALAAIAEAAQIGPRDVVLEIGPGAGNLTRLLSQKADQGAVLAVDLDRRLLEAAQVYHAELRNVTWLHADALAGKHKIEPQIMHTLRELQHRHGGDIRLVSNLPYNAASPLVAELLVECWKQSRLTNHDPRTTPLLTRMAFTVQWEVAIRMTAGPGSRDYGPLGILIQSMAQAEIIRKIGRSAFWPAPKIQSALVAVRPCIKQMALIPDAIAWQQFLAAIFSHRRQTIANALKHAYRDRWNPTAKNRLISEGFDLSRRPEQFGITELLALQTSTAALGAAVRSRDH